MISSNTIQSALHASTCPRMLATGAQLRAASGDWSACPLVGIDTEFFRERTYRAELGLVQVSDGVTAWLVDPLQLDSLEPLRELFTNPTIVKVLHSASEDLEVLWHTLGVVPEPMVDTQIACAMLGQPLQMSYHHAVKWMTGVEVDKELTRSNWLHRPLTREQLHYAATDVIFLPAMHQELQRELIQRGRLPWLQEDVTRMVESNKQAPDHENAYQRLRGGNSLDESSLHVLKAVAAWREKTAGEQNLARGFVLTDAALLQLASSKPESESELLKIQGIHPNSVKKHLAALLNIIDQNRTLTGAIEQLSPLTRQQKNLLESMRSRLQSIAQDLNVDPAILASRRQLEALVRAHEAGSPIPERLNGWRWPIITEKLLTLVSNAGSG